MGVCDRAIAVTAQFWAIGIISETSPHLKDVPFVLEFWWRTYGLGAISPRKKNKFRRSLPLTTLRTTLRALFLTYCVVMKPKQEAMSEVNSVVGSSTLTYIHCVSKKFPPLNSL